MKNTLQDINVFLAKKQSEQVVLLSSLIEKNSILATMPMKAASHGFQNVYSKIVDVDTMQEVDYDEDLPTVGISFDLGVTRLGKIGGKLPMPMDAAKEMGGFAKYANDRYPTIIAKSGNENEARVYYKGFIKAAVENGKITKAGGTTDGKQYSMAFVHYDEASTIGLYNPNSLSNGKLFATLMLNGGNVYDIDINGRKCLGKMMAMFMEFGLQLADPDAVGAIVNIEPAADPNDPDKIKGLPSAMQINDRLAAVRADTSSTFIYAHPVLLNYLAIKYNLEKRTVTNDITNVSYQLVDWNGVPMIGSYNINWGNESVIA